jgi:5-methylcytosine-specific restriction protein A
MHPFVIGREYSRTVLLDFLGSKQGQSGILWGNQEPGCLICTFGGRHGKEAGYSDEAQGDGTWLYIGQGRTGDQSADNTANAKMIVGEKSVLLFSTREPLAREIKSQGHYGKLFMFRGSFNAMGHEFFIPSNGPRKGDRLIRFHLCPAEMGQVEIEPGSIDAAPKSLRMLQKEIENLSRPSKSGKIGFREYKIRSSQVHKYALLRANGICEACSKPAPFVDAAGKAFLEVHHILRLADDGPDAPGNVAAICPNCHRRAHSGNDKLSFGKFILQRVAIIEQDIGEE